MNRADGENPKCAHCSKPEDIVAIEMLCRGMDDACKDCHDALEPV